METVRDFSSVDLASLTVKSRGPSYNGVETFDIDYAEQGPLYLAIAVPLVVVKGVRVGGDGHEFVILCQKNLPAELLSLLRDAVEHLAKQSLALRGFVPLFAGGDSAALGLAHDFRMFDREGKPILDYKNKSGYYRIMFAFDMAVIRDGVLTAAPKIQQMQYMEDLKQVFDHCYWQPPAMIKVRKDKQKKKKKRTLLASLFAKSRKPVKQSQQQWPQTQSQPQQQQPQQKPEKMQHQHAPKPISEHRVRKQRVHGAVDPHAGLGLDENAMFP